jgi:hypothetical protein
MTHAKFSTDGTTWTTATFTTTVSGNFVNFENTYYNWGALTSTGQIWKNFQVTDSLGSFSVSSLYPSGITQLSSFNDEFIALLGSDCQFSDNLEQWGKSLLWTTVSSNFGNTGINSIAYGNNLWVAGGRFGQMRISTDATTWTTVTSNLGGTIISIAYGNNLWVAGASGGQMRTSTNGSTWTTVTSNFGNSVIRSIAYANGLWVAGGDGGQMRTSTNGSTWTTVTSNFGTVIRSIAYGNNLWVAGGYSGQIRTSTNGSIWTTVTSNFGNTQISSIAYGNNLWVAGGNAGQMRISTDATTWTTVTSNLGGAIISIAYGNNLWVAGANAGQMRISTDATTWTTVTSNFGNTQISSVAHGNNLWVAGEYTGQIRTSFNPLGENFNKFIKSEDKQKGAFLNNNGILFNWNGIGYKRISTGINDNFVNGAIRNNGGTYEYIIQGNNAMYYSTNLTTWTTISKPPASSVNDIIAK